MLAFDIHPVDWILAYASRHSLRRRMICRLWLFFRQLTPKGHLGCCYISVGRLVYCLQLSSPDCRHEFIGSRVCVYGHYYP